MAPLEVYNPGLHDLIAPDAPIERIAGGLGFTEGPVWRGTSLLFSDTDHRPSPSRFRQSADAVVS